jgi:hypothetical protein
MADERRDREEFEQLDRSRDEMGRETDDAVGRADEEFEELEDLDEEEDESNLSDGSE